MNDIDKYSQKDFDGQGRNTRLLREWKEIDTMCKKRKMSNPKTPSIKYKARKRVIEGLPITYEITFHCKSIVGVEDTPPPRKPIFGYEHTLRIELPLNYPSADGNPRFTFLTKVWHPNIRYEGGDVCLTIPEMGVMVSLTTLILRVEEYLKYQLYHAKNTYPYPMDDVVAEWVREEAEPNGWTHFDQTMPEVNTPSDGGTPVSPKETVSPTDDQKPKKKRIVL